MCLLQQRIIAIHNRKSQLHNNRNMNCKKIRQVKIMKQKRIFIGTIVVLIKCIKVVNCQWVQPGLVVKERFFISGPYPTANSMMTPIQQQQLYGPMVTAGGRSNRPGMQINRQQQNYNNQWNNEQHRMPRGTGFGNDASVVRFSSCKNQPFSIRNHKITADFLQNWVLGQSTC